MGFFVQATLECIIAIVVKILQIAENLDRGLNTLAYNVLMFGKISRVFRIHLAMDAIT